MKKLIDIILLSFIVFIDITLSARQSDKIFKNNPLKKAKKNQADYGRRSYLRARWSSDDSSPEIWSNSTLTYTIKSYPSHITEKNTKKIIREAFKAWTDYIPLDITEACSTCLANFVINFKRGKVSDEFEFDGIGGILAYAYRPEDGEILFDKDEIWKETFKEGDTNLFLVAVHTIGHALGLEHLVGKDSIMSAKYKMMPKNDVISQVDRDAIQGLYGKKQPTTQTTTSITRTITISKSSYINPDDKVNIRCETYLDAAFYHPDGTLHTIKQGVLWRYLLDDHKWEDEPVEFSEEYPQLSLPKQIVAGVYNVKKNQVILFTNEFIYHYSVGNKNHLVTEKRLPRNLRNTILGAIYYLNNIYVITRTSIRLYQEDDFFQLSQERSFRNEFPGIRGTIKTAFTYDGLHYFFTIHGRIYVWDEQLRTWHTKDRPMKTGWFACSTDSEPDYLSHNRGYSVPKQRNQQYFPGYPFGNYY